MKQWPQVLPFVLFGIHDGLQVVKESLYTLPCENFAGFPHPLPYCQSELPINRVMLQRVECNQSCPLAIICGLFLLNTVAINQLPKNRLKFY